MSGAAEPPYRNLKTLEGDCFEDWALPESRVGVSSFCEALSFKLRSGVSGNCLTDILINYQLQLIN